MSTTNRRHNCWHIQFGMTTFGWQNTRQLDRRPVSGRVCCLSMCVCAVLGELVQQNCARHTINTATNTDTEHTECEKERKNTASRASIRRRARFVDGTWWKMKTNGSGRWTWHAFYSLSPPTCCWRCCRRSCRRRLRQLAGSLERQFRRLQLCVSGLSCTRWYAQLYRAHCRLYGAMCVFVCVCIRAFIIFQCVSVYSAVFAVLWLWQPPPPQKMYLLYEDCDCNFGRAWFNHFLRSVREPNVQCETRRCPSPWDDRGLRRRHKTTRAIPTLMMWTRTDNDN